MQDVLSTGKISDDKCYVRVRVTIPNYGNSAFCFLPRILQLVSKAIAS